MIRNNNYPLVSIICITYNHENYIRQALDSFIMQKTTFPFEIIVHDDASTDNTQLIVKEYESKHPGLFNIIYQIENQFSKNERNIWFDITFPVAKGKYIALCDGDDYWTDLLKLQKQVDFLQENPSHTGVFHNVLFKYEGRNRENLYIDVAAGGKSYNFEELVKLNPIHTSSFLFRNNLINTNVKYFGVVGDRPLFTLLSNLGPIQYLNFVGSCYRINQNSIWSPLGTNKQILLVIESYRSIFRFLKSENRRSVKIKIAGYYFNLSLERNNGLKDRLKYILLAFKWTFKISYLFYGIKILRSFFENKFSKS